MDKADLFRAVEAVAQGYSVTPNDDILIVENPKYQPDNGEDPNLVVELQELKDWLARATERQPGVIQFGVVQTCRCPTPMIRCDNRGCFCDLCGLPEPIDLPGVPHDY